MKSIFSQTFDAEKLNVETKKDESLVDWKKVVQ